MKKLSIGVFDCITILGPGLLGASIAQAVRERALVKAIHIWAHRAETRLACEQANWCDQVFADPKAAVEAADLVVLATPVDSIIDLLGQIGAHLNPGTLVTDVGSTKGMIARHGATQVTAPSTFIGAHPMAGSEKSGWRYATPTFFEGRACFITPTEDTPAERVDPVARFWKRLGMDIHTVSPDLHDEIVANISHLPHIVAATLCSLLANQPEEWMGFSGNGLKDTTRVAGGSPEMWLPILQHNEEEILRTIRAFQDELHALERSIHNRKPFEVKAFLERSQHFRKRLPPGDSPG